MTKIRKSANGEDCSVRIPGVCNFDNATVVYAHINGAGVGLKQSDLFGAYACSCCHAWLDGGYAKTHTREQRDYEHLRAMMETQGKLLNKGLVKI